MYKNFFMGIAAMAALTLVSCSSDDLNSFSDNSSKNEAISFDGYLGRSAVAVNGSRGSVLEITDLQNSTEGFGVFGKHTNGQVNDYNFFKNQPVTYKNSKWTYSPLKFWPTQGSIDFLAYAPYVKGQKLNDYTSTFVFTVENEVAKQTDLLWANAKGQTKDNISSTEKKVKFHFAHALSRLGYTVKLYGDYASNADFTLNQITLAGSADGKTLAFYKTGTIDLSKTTSEGLWSNQSSDKQNFDWVSTPYSVTSTEPSTKDKNYLFVIPQDFSQSKTEGHQDVDELYVIVKYTIKYKNNDETQINKVYKKLPIKFEQGKAYMLNLTIGLPIEFDAEVTPWGNDIVIPDGKDIDTWDGIE